MTATLGPALEIAKFDDARFSTVTLLANEHVRVFVAAFEPGQAIPLHAPEVDLAITVAAGEGELYADGGVHPLTAGDVAVVPAGETRGIRAVSERLVVVNTVTPPPGSGDHGRGSDVSWPAPGQ